MRTTRRNYSRAAATLASLTLVAAACGGNSSKAAKTTATTSSPATVAPCTSPGVSSGEIKVGLVYAQSGNIAAQYAAFGTGIQARFNEENNKGGIGGRKLVIVAKDDANDATRNLEAAKQLIESDKVFGVIEGAPRAEGGAAYLNQNAVPVTGFTTGSVVWGKYRNMFGYNGSTDPNGTAVITTQAKFMYDQGARNAAAIAFAGSEASANNAKNFKKAFESLGGKVGYLTTDIPFGSTDFTADAQRMKSAGVDSLYGPVTSDSYIAALLAAEQAGLKLKVPLAATAYEQRLLQAYGKRMAGLYVASDTVPFESDTPPLQTYFKAVGAVNPAQVRDARAMTAWVSADLFIRGLREAGAACPTRDAFIQNLRKTKDWSADGLVPPVDFEGTFGKPPLCSYFVKVNDQGTAFVPLSTTPTCGTQLSG
jgi:branched-chain amino acid transport system substrate-binding protein